MKLIGSRKKRRLRIYRLDIPLSYGLITEEEVNRIEDMVFSKDPEIAKIGDILANNIIREFYAKDYNNIERKEDHN